LGVDRLQLACKFGRQGFAHPGAIVGPQGDPRVSGLPGVQVGGVQASASRT
jgi:hypothetical protein